MALRRWFLATTCMLLVGTLSQAQVVVVNPPPVFGPGFGPVGGIPVLVPNGVGFRYRSGNLSVGGFLGTGSSLGVLYPPAPIVPLAPQPIFVPRYSVLPTYGVVNNNITVQIIAPTVSLRAPSSAPDLSGVDLDVVAPPWAPPRAAPPKVADAGARVPEKKPAPPLPEVKLPPAPPAPAPPKVDVPPNANALLQAGVRAFRDKELGLASQRFRQALELDPKSHEAHFYLAQTFLAVGKYDDAFDSIANGLKLNPDWPRAKFTPRVELYGLHIEDWQKHFKTLEDAQKADAKNGKLQFLVGYTHWFNGNQPEAFDFIRRARPLLIDPAPAQRFLDAAPVVVRK